MNVLFVGKWDIAGAYIADRFLREGNEVCWMTDESSQILWNKKFKGNIYRGSWRKEECRRIIKANSVDTVVFLTGDFREHYEEVTEYESQMTVLTELMTVLRDYPLKCLLYLSSLELDYQDNSTPVLTDLAAGEMLCETYHKAYGMPILILRMGCVYGNVRLHDMGYTGYVLNKMRLEGQIRSDYAPEDMLDVIYGEDVAVAVNSLLRLECRGLYRLSTGHPVTMETYFRCLGKVAGIPPVIIWERQKTTAPESFFRGEKRVKEETGWIPFFLLEEKGLGKLEQSVKRQEEEERPEKHRKLLQMAKKFWENTFLQQILETMLLYVVTCFFLQFSKDVTDLKYVDFRLMFVAVISCRHGIRMGGLAIVLACMSYVYSLIKSQIDVSYLIHSVDSWLPFTVYFVTGALIGYIVDQKRDKQEALEEKYALLTEKYEFLKMIHGETLEIKRNLQRQIVTSKHSFGNAYEVASELDSLKPELILIRVISILEKFMESEKVAVFLINWQYPRFARLKACSNSLREELKTSLDMNNYGKMTAAFEKSGFFVNTELLYDYPYYAAPVYYQGNIYGFIAIYDVSPDKFTVYNQNLFRMVTSLIEKNLVKALQFEEARRDELYYERTDLLRPEAFKDRICTMEANQENICGTYVKGKVYPLADMEREEASRMIESVIRGTDFCGIDEDGDYAVFLINASSDCLDLIKERFNKNGLILEVG